jgi:aryl-alcohol dehydrogenase-like predicted oxidoreductase
MDPGNRNDLVITTKLNWGGANGEVLVNNHGLSRKHIIEGLRASLKRLDLEYVDVVYAHRPDRLTPMEETVRAFNHVIETKGWALYWGTSEWAADEIAEACGIAKQLGLIGPIVEQPQYNLLARTKVEGEFQRLYSRFGLGLTTFSPLKFGVLSGKYNDSPEKPPAGSRFAEGDDKFVSGMREAYGNRDWREMIESAIKLKVCHLSFCLPHRQRQHNTEFLHLKRKLLTRYSPSQTNSASAKRSYRLHGVSRTPTFRRSLRARRGPSKSSRTAKR